MKIVLQNISYTIGIINASSCLFVHQKPIKTGGVPYSKISSCPIKKMNTCMFLYLYAHVWLSRNSPKLCGVAM